MFEEDYKQEHESLAYTLSTRIKGNHAIFNFELRHLQAYVPEHSIRDYWHRVNDIYENSFSSMTVVSLSPSAEGTRLSPLVCSIAGALEWLLTYVLSRKKRPTQDRLSFLLRIFQKFCCIFIVLSILGIS